MKLGRKDIFNNAYLTVEEYRRRRRLTALVRVPVAVMKHHHPKAIGEERVSLASTL